MKATITFNLDDPDDKMAHLRAVKSHDMAQALWHIFHNLPKSIYNKFRDTTEEMDMLHDLWVREIADTLDDHGINVDDLTI